MKHLRLGIVGAENSHSWQIGKLCNIDKAVPVRVTHIWGEKPEYASAAAERGQIPEIVSNWKSMIGQVDGVMIDHRHGKYHAAVAQEFIKAGIPTFADKPMTCSLKEAVALFKLADEHGTPLITWSSKPLQKGFQDFVKRVKKSGGITILNTSGPADIKSKYGGIFFYGIHQVDSLIEAMGTEVEQVNVVRNGENGVATVKFSGGRLATMNLVKTGGVFHNQVVTPKETFGFLEQNDPNPYSVTAKLIHGLLKSGKVPFSRERMLAPIAVLEALEKSVKTNKPQKIAKF